MQAKAACCTLYSGASHTMDGDDKSRHIITCVSSRFEGGTNIARLMQFHCILHVVCSPTSANGAFFLPNKQTALCELLNQRVARATSVYVKMFIYWYIYLSIYFDVCSVINRPRIMFKLKFLMSCKRLKFNCMEETGTRRSCVANQHFHGYLLTQSINQSIRRSLFEQANCIYRLRDPHCIYRPRADRF